MYLVVPFSKTRVSRSQRSQSSFLMMVSCRSGAASSVPSPTVNPFGSVMSGENSSYGWRCLLYRRTWDSVTVHHLWNLQTVLPWHLVMVERRFFSADGPMSWRIKQLPEIDMKLLCL